MSENDEPGDRSAEETPVIYAALSRPRKTNIVELVGPALLSFPEPTRLRWIAALNANQFDIRRMDPDPELDVDDESIPDEKFAFHVQVYLTDEGEFSSIQFPITALGRYVVLPPEPGD